MKTLLWLVVALPLAAAGQGVGIDLNAPPPPDKPAPEEPAQPTPAKPSDKDKEKPKSSLETAVGVPGERDAALGDRVKAVQRKGFLKRGRLQLTGFFSPSVNDAFYQKYGFGARLAYNVADSLALGVRGSYYSAVQTDYKKQGVLAFQSLLLSSKLHNELMGEAVWSPVYGKVAFLGHSIIHFDLYLVAGFGAVRSDTSLPPRNEGWHPATDFGGGIRFYPLDYLSVEAGLLATLYPDQTDRAVPATLQNVLVATLGVSFFFPMHFEYVYP